MFSILLKIQKKKNVRNSYTMLLKAPECTVYTLCYQHFAVLFSYVQLWKKRRRKAVYTSKSRNPALKDDSAPPHLPGPM